VSFGEKPLFYARPAFPDRGTRVATDGSEASEPPSLSRSGDVIQLAAGPTRDSSLISCDFGLQSSAIYPSVFVLPTEVKIVGSPKLSPTFLFCPHLGAANAFAFRPAGEARDLLPTCLSPRRRSKLGIASRLRLFLCGRKISLYRKKGPEAVTLCWMEENRAFIKFDDMHSLDRRSAMYCLQGNISTEPEGIA
jgi:hypothetical protein